MTMKLNCSSLIGRESRTFRYRNSDIVLRAKVSNPEYGRKSLRARMDGMKLGASWIDEEIGSRRLNTKKKKRFGGMEGVLAGAWKVCLPYG
jgi:hypothetical protein